MANQTTKPRARQRTDSDGAVWVVNGQGQASAAVCLDRALSNWNTAVLAQATGKQSQPK